VWAKAPNGAIDAGGHLQLTSRELLKIGTLVLNGGRYQAKQIVSRSWVQRSTSPLTPVYERRYKYGYLWWVDEVATSPGGKPVRVVFAWGNGGTYLFIVPERSLVVVFTGKNYNSSLGLLPQKWVPSVILPALQ
jgi:CubicO group peptidase (beta-lactamase class C family)